MQSSMSFEIGRWLRLAWTLVSLGFVVITVFAVSTLPMLLLLRTLWNAEYSRDLSRLLVVAAAALPAYAMFALVLMVLSAISTRLTGWQTRADLTLRIRDLDPALLDWVRSMVFLHIVRVLVGSLFRATPLWSFYLRLNGARIGRRVFVNSLAVTDHNLLDFGDDVIIGDTAHIAGHTVEDGFLKTGRVRLGRGVTVGVASVVGIGVDAGPGCRVGALSVVPKFAKLEAGATYIGVPARKVQAHATTTVAAMTDATKRAFKDPA
jgi:acetyltransferase-like isoleucine patch superfamily enzyme